MNRIFLINTEDWSLEIWCKDISRHESIFNTTLLKRNQEKNIKLGIAGGSIILSNQCTGTYQILQEPLCVISKCKIIRLEKPIFFENLQYHFEWIFNNQLDVDYARLEHKLEKLNNGFRFSKRRESILQGLINTGNDLGWLELPMQYETRNQIKNFTIAFEIVPVKMDLQQDINNMYRAIDKELPFWRFSIPSKTEQSSNKSQKRGNFELLWLARFTFLREQLTWGLKLIINSPHHRLLPEQKKIRADRITRSITPSLAEKIRRDFLTGHTDKHYSVVHKRLAYNTQENKFIKHVVKYIQQRLARISQSLKNSNSDEFSQFSVSFLMHLELWQKPLIQFQQQKFLKSVDEFDGVNNGSFVLQQKTGYSKVYNIWQELRHYLDLFGLQDKVSMKPISEIYEVWCFLEIRRILIEELNFAEVKKTQSPLAIGLLGERHLRNGMKAAFEFVRSDGITIRLVHEPHFTEKTIPIRSWMVSHKPDILLEVSFCTTRHIQQQEKIIWLFDAKYRIKQKNTAQDGIQYDDSPDLAPDDAINQMHRYRDALIYQHTEENNSNQLNPTLKSRPVLGAFALYPGYFEQSFECTNPYQEQIEKIGIGAFALLPSTENEHPKMGSFWLTQFLKDQLRIKQSVIQDSIYSPPTLQNLYLQDSIRIANAGMRVVRYTNLTLTIGLGDQTKRTKEYNEGFSQGSARWYHLPKKTFHQKYADHLIREIAFLAIGQLKPQSYNELEDTKKSYHLSIQFIWRIKSVRLIERNKITNIQAGYNKPNDEELYWLFELYDPLLLPEPVCATGLRRFSESMKFVQIEHLINTNNFESIIDLYAEGFNAEI